MSQHVFILTALQEIICYLTLSLVLAHIIINSIFYQIWSRNIRVIYSFSFKKSSFSQRTRMYFDLSWFNLPRFHRI